MTPTEPSQIRPAFTWDAIDCVLLDMDGTLLDKYFDDYFWEHYVPEVYARLNDLSPDEARRRLLSRYRQVEATLQWTDLDYWSEQLGLDIPELKCRINHLIQIHPHVIDFLSFLDKKGKQIHLVTNAHSKTLAIKLRKTRIGSYFSGIICSEVVGKAKEQPVFWEKLEEIIGFDKRRTLLADDTVPVLASAREYGIAYLIHIARPSSRQPVSYSAEFPSIAYFDELIF
ncbi:HAD hydrolase-like protein [Desulfoprunum benzoelyticum]|uniref:Putative hydrolase of the HAD superfamily n=1 Tax=Desulfoprunum benzoelyticum TaxID=1506996 RepID=A0A840UZ96_9BACT|nr:HAD family hydrolase [Desulfoprunum benzoelyticum]MBB5346850.1 putative hydrolase of the HAD superfamily [Desulfoprunum benzoelyticum]MBM9529488.1 HAD hydrolase-like protein [Desulfoprunum benzoelyticum]